MDIAVAFGRVLRRFRKKAKLTQEQLGFEADLERNYISMLELGQRQPTLSTIIKLARPLDVSGAELVAEVESLSGQAAPDCADRKPA